MALQFSESTLTPEQVLRNRAYDLLARREHSAHELRQKLSVIDDMDEHIVADVVQVLAEEGLQSDQRFTRSFLRMRANQGKGLMRIRQELRQKGIETDLIQLTEQESDIDWYQLSAEILQRKFRRNHHLCLEEDFKVRRTFEDKMRRFLAYRGFDGSQIGFAIEQFRQLSPDDLAF